MILPIGHQEREVRRLPWVTFSLIAACAFVFLFTDSQTAFQRFGLVPSALNAHSFVTHMFMHAGWFHLFGNLIMLMLAGPAIEDRFGRPMFAAFYGISGVFAAAFYAALASDPSIPMVGAAGAMAGGCARGRCPRSGSATSCSRRGSGTRSAWPEEAWPTGRTWADSRSAPAPPMGSARPGSRSA